MHTLVCDAIKSGFIELPEKVLGCHPTQCAASVQVDERLFCEQPTGFGSVPLLLLEPAEPFITDLRTAMTPPLDLTRFLTAQSPVIDTVLAELTMMQLTLNRTSNP